MFPEYLARTYWVMTRYMTINIKRKMQINVTVKKIMCTLVQALRLCTGRTAHRGSIGVALPFHDHGTRRVWGVSITLRPLFTLGKNPVPIVQEAGWAPGPVWTVRKISPPPEFDLRTFQPVASRHTDWATRSTKPLLPLPKFEPWIVQLLHPLRYFGCLCGLTTYAEILRKAELDCMQTTCFGVLIGHHEVWTRTTLVTITCRQKQGFLSFRTQKVMP